jgi:hypothetical protein
MANVTLDSTELASATSLFMSAVEQAAHMKAGRGRLKGDGCFEHFAAEVGLQPSSGNFNNLVGTLRTAGLINYPQQGVVEPADWLAAMA